MVVSITKLLLLNLGRRLALLQTVLGLSGTWILQAVKNLVPKLLTNPHFRDLLRFVFLGSLVELTRSATEKATDLVKHCRFSRMISSNLYYLIHARSFHGKGYFQQRGLRV